MMWLLDNNAWIAYLNPRPSPVRARIRKEARQFGHIRAALARQGTPIGPYDLQIAAIALANDLTLVTHNTAEFRRVDGLKLADLEA